MVILSLLLLLFSVLLRHLPAFLQQPLRKFVETRHHQRDLARILKGWNSLARIMLHNTRIILEFCIGIHVLTFYRNFMKFLTRMRNGAFCGRARRGIVAAWRMRRGAWRTRFRRRASRRWRVWPLRRRGIARIDVASSSPTRRKTDEATRKKKEFWWILNGICRKGWKGWNKHEVLRFGVNGWNDEKIERERERCARNGRKQLGNKFMKPSLWKQWCFFKRWNESSPYTVYYGRQNDPSWIEK